MPALPVAFDAHLLAAVDDRYQDPFEQQPDNGLALFLGRCLGTPECRQVSCQVADRSQLDCARRCGLSTLKAFVIRFQSGLLG